MNARDLDSDVAGCAAAHQRLLADLADLDDRGARAPSLLPGWTVGHVLTHLARNAESFVGMLHAAAKGRSGEQYPGGFEQRGGDIEAGAGRPAADLVDDVRRTIWALEGAWAAAPATTWSIVGKGLRDAEIPIVDVPNRRWREVEIHHADLGRSFTWEHWSAAFVRGELARQAMIWASRRPMGMTSLPPEALAATPHHRLAWLVGRAEIAGLGPAGIFL